MISYPVLKIAYVVADFRRTDPINVYDVFTLFEDSCSIALQSLFFFPNSQFSSIMLVPNNMHNGPEQQWIVQHQNEV